MSTATDCVTLSLSEITLSVVEAALRMAVSNARGLNHSTTYSRTFMERLRQEFVGVVAERAWSKYSNQYYRSPINEFHATPDADRGVEVRGVDSPKKRLIVRDNDADDRRFVSLVVDDNGTATVRGWILGADAKRDEWLDNPNGYRTAWFVPSDQLRPVEEMFEF